MTGSGESDLSELPDIEIGATVRAKRLRFDGEPETDVTLHGDRRSRTESERENLPDEVEPGVEYRDVEVRWRAAAHVDVQMAPELRDRALEDPD